MSAPGPAWSDEEEDLLRSLAAAGESAAAIATLLNRRPPRGAQAGSRTQHQVGPFAAGGEDKEKILVPTTNRQIQRLIFLAQSPSD